MSYQTDAIADSCKHADIMSAEMNVRIEDAVYSSAIASIRVPKLYPREHHAAPITACANGGISAAVAGEVT